MFVPSVCRVRLLQTPICFCKFLRPKSSVAATHVVDVHNSARTFQEMPGPTGSRSWPVIGSLFHFKPFTNYTMQSFNRLMDELHEAHGPIFRMRLGKWVVVTEDPIDIETVFRNEGKYPIRPPLDLQEVYIKRRNRPKSLGVLNGEDWHEMRGRIQKRLVRPRAAIEYLPAQNKVADEFIRLLKSRTFSSEEIKDLYFRYAVEAIAVVCFSKRLGFLSDGPIPKENEDYLQSVKEFFLLLANHFGTLPMYKYFRTPLYNRLEKAADTAYGFAERQVEEAIKLIEKTGAREKEGQPNFLLSLLGDKAISYEEIGGILQDLMVGGTDSTAKNLEFFMYNMATNPEKQTKLYEEIHSVIGKSGPLTEDALKQMNYLRACQKECFRVQFPTPVGTGRLLANDVVLSGYHVPKGVMVIMNNPRLLKNPKYFDDSEKFLPERWLRGSDGQRSRPIPPVALLPFGFGPRNCVGRRFAEQELALVVVKILQNFHVSVPEDMETPEVVFDVFATFSKPVDFQFTPR